MLNDRIRARLAASRRWHPAEFVLWGLALAAVFLLPRQLLILNEIAILALFAISLDLILGYAGLVSLGHAAFLGVGAYAAGLLAIHVTARWPRRWRGSSPARSSSRATISRG